MSEPRLADPAEIAAAMPATERLLVLADFDGTLSEIVDDPDAAGPVDGALDALRAVAERCPVAIVSGRHLADLQARIGEELPITLAGSHGTEVRRPDGSVDSLVDPESVRAVLDDLEDRLGDLLDTSQGWRIERKPTSIAVHYRQVADPADDLDRVHEILGGATASPPGWQLLDGKMVTELRPAGVDKGGVVDRLTDASDGRVPVFLGDDVTDEDAFRAVERHGGVTVLVADEPRESAARWRVTGPTEIVTLLGHLADVDLSHSG